MGVINILKAIIRSFFQNYAQVNIKSINVNGGKLLTNRLEMLKQLPKNSVIAECGVDNGDFSQLILDHCKPKKLYLIDSWGSRRYNQKKYENLTKRFAIETNKGIVEIIRGDSITSAKKFKNNYFDWIYIDTDHSFLTTKKELNAYEPKIKKDGFIALHDYVQGNFKKFYQYGVIEAVAEFVVSKSFKIDFITVDHIENSSVVISRIKN